MRLRKTDRELLASVDDFITDHLDSKQQKAWSSFYERVLSEEMSKARKETSYPVRDAIRVIQEVGGKRVYMPAGKPGAAWFITLQNRIKSSGLTEALMREATELALINWKGSIKVESIIRQADKLLAEATTPSSTPSLREREEDLDEL